MALECRSATEILPMLKALFSIPRKKEKIQAILVHPYFYTD